MTVYYCPLFKVALAEWNLICIIDTIFLINTVNLLWRFLFWIKLYIKVMWHTHNECNNLSHTWSLSVEFCSHSLPFIRQPLLLSTSGVHTRFRLSLILDHFLKNFNYLWRSSCRSVLMRPAYTDSLTAPRFPMSLGCRFGAGRFILQLL